MSLIKRKPKLTIVQAERGRALDNVRSLFREYADSLHFDLCFQDYTEQPS